MFLHLLLIGSGLRPVNLMDHQLFSQIKFAHIIKKVLVLLAIMSHVWWNNYLCGSHVRHKAFCVHMLPDAHLHTDSCCGFTIRPQCSVWAGSLSHFMCVVRADNCDTWECLVCLLFDQLWLSKRALKKYRNKHLCSSSADLSSARVSRGGLWQKPRVAQTITPRFGGSRCSRQMFTLRPWALEQTCVMASSLLKHSTSLLASMLAHKSWISACLKVWQFTFQALKPVGFATHNVFVFFAYRL